MFGTMKNSVIKNANTDLTLPHPPFLTFSLPMMLPGFGVTPHRVAGPGGVTMQEHTFADLHGLSGGLSDHSGLGGLVPPTGQCQVQTADMQAEQNTYFSG